MTASTIGCQCLGGTRIQELSDESSVTLVLVTLPAGCPGNQVLAASEDCMASQMLGSGGEVAKMTNAWFQVWVLGFLGVLGF